MVGTRLFSMSVAQATDFYGFLEKVFASKLAPQVTQKKKGGGVERYNKKNKNKSPLGLYVKKIHIFFANFFSLIFFHFFNKKHKHQKT